jgi:hypothetical protein
VSTPFEKKGTPKGVTAITLLKKGSFIFQLFLSSCSFPALLEQLERNSCSSKAGKEQLERNSWKGTAGKEGEGKDKNLL